MRKLLDITCPRCGARSSHDGLSIEIVRELAKLHVCADGFMSVRYAEPTERIVLGPGERTKLPEERA